MRSIDRPAAGCALHEIGHALGLDDEYSGYRNQFPGSGTFSIKVPRPYAGFTVFIGSGHIADLGDFPLMIYSAPMGKRQLISFADALLISQFSLFDRPDISEPPLGFNGDGQGVPTRSVSSSPTCLVRPPNTNDGQGECQYQPSLAVESNRIPWRIVAASRRQGTQRSNTALNAWRIRTLCSPLQCHEKKGKGLAGNLTIAGREDRARL